MEISSVGSEVREFHALRHDRVRVIPGPDVWPEAFDYAVAGRSVRIEGEAARPGGHCRALFTLIALKAASATTRPLPRPRRRGLRSGSEVRYQEPIQSGA